VSEFDHVHLTPFRSLSFRTALAPAPRGGVALLAILFLLPCAMRVTAQTPSQTNAASSPLSPSRLTGGGPVAARALANQVNDPTAPVTLVQFRDVIAPNVPGYSNPGNLLQIEPVFPIFPTRLTPFEQLMKLTIPVPTLPSPGSQTGLGDLSLFDVATFKQSWGKWGFGPALVFPTATSTALGQGKWQAGPAVAAIYTGINNLTVGAVLQNPISFAGSSSRPAVNALSITPTLTYNLPHGWFAGYSDFDWSFNWKEGGTATIPLGVQVGKVFKLGKVPVSLSVEAANNVVRPSGAPEWLVCLELTVIFKTFRDRH
jgi:hypothetical protein